MEELYQFTKLYMFGEESKIDAFLTSSRRCKGGHESPVYLIISRLCEDGKKLVLLIQAPHTPPQTNIPRESSVLAFQLLGHCINH